MPLSFCGTGSLSGGISSCVVVPIEWQLMPVCATNGYVWLITIQAASIPGPAIFRENEAALDANLPKISSCNQHKLDQVRAAIGSEQRTRLKCVLQFWLGRRGSRSRSPEWRELDLVSRQGVASRSGMDHYALAHGEIRQLGSLAVSRNVNRRRGQFHFDGFTVSGLHHHGIGVDFLQRAQDVFLISVGDNGVGKERGER